MPHPTQQFRNGPCFVLDDREHGFIFVWDAVAPEIEVVVDGLVADTITLDRTVGVRNASANRWKEWFTLVCHNYVRTKVPS